MTRDRGYPDWLVLSARLLAQPSCGQVTIVQNRCLIVFPCGYVKILQPVAICTVIFVTKSYIESVLSFSIICWYGNLNVKDCDFEEEGRRHRIAFNSLYLFSFRSIIYEANGEELYNFTRGATLSSISQYAAGSVGSFANDSLK